MEVREGSSEAVGPSRMRTCPREGEGVGRRRVAGAVAEDGMVFRVGGAGWHGVSRVRLSVGELPRGSCLAAMCRVTGEKGSWGEEGRGRHRQSTEEQRRARGRLAVWLKTRLWTGAEDKGERRLEGGRGPGVHFPSMLFPGEARGRRRQDSGSGKWLGGLEPGPPSHRHQVYLQAGQGRVELAGLPAGKLRMGGALPAALCGHHPATSSRVLGRAEGVKASDALWRPSLTELETYARP